MNTKGMTQRQLTNTIRHLENFVERDCSLKTWSAVVRLLFDETDIDAEIWWRGWNERNTGGGTMMSSSISTRPNYKIEVARAHSTWYLLLPSIKIDEEEFPVEPVERKWKVRGWGDAKMLL
jgi:hypothetical protein